MKVWVGIVSMALIATAFTRAQAETYPSHPVRMMVPASAGGLTDFIARVAADYLAKRTNETFIVENRGGAGGNLADDVVAKAAPDGYTLGLVASGNLVINPYLYKSMPFNAKNDLIPVAPIADAPRPDAAHGRPPGGPEYR